MDKPIFVSGLRKSGTSMVKNLLDGHPELFVYPPNELHFFRNSYHDSVKKDKRNYIRDPNELLKTLSKINFVQRMDNKSSYDYREQFDVEEFNKIIKEQEVEEMSEIYYTLYEAAARSSSHLQQDIEDVRFASKTVLETEFLPELLEWYPDLKFVYVLRNPYGHFCSARNSLRSSGGGEGSSLGFFANPYPFIGSEIHRMSLSYYFMRKYESLYPDNFYLLVYDRILENPEKELRELASFLDIEYHKSMTNPTICGEPWGGNSWYEDEFEGIDPSPLDHWKDDISKLEIKLINTHFEGIIEEYGFEVLEGDVSILRPFAWNEWPWMYAANRITFLSKQLFGTD